MGGDEGGEEVVVAAGAGLQDGDAGGGVGDEDVEQSVAASGDVLQVVGAVAGQIGDGLAAAGGDVEDAGAESVAHALIVVGVP